MQLLLAGVADAHESGDVGVAGEHQTETEQRHYYQQQDYQQDRDLQNEHLVGLQEVALLDKVDEVVPVLQRPLPLPFQVLELRVAVHVQLLLGQNLVILDLVDLLSSDLFLPDEVLDVPQDVVEKSLSFYPVRL